MTREQAAAMYDHYDRLINELSAAQLALIGGGVKSYTIGDRNLTRFDLGEISDQIEKAVKARDLYAAIMNGKAPRKTVAVIPRDF